MRNYVLNALTLTNPFKTAIWCRENILEDSHFQVDQDYSSSCSQLSSCINNVDSPLCRNWSTVSLNESNLSTGGFDPQYQMTSGITAATHHVLYQRRYFQTYKVHPTTQHEDVEVKQRYNSKLSSTPGTRCGGWLTPRLGIFTPGKKAGTHCTKDWMGHKGLPGRGRKISPHPRFDPRTMQPAKNVYTNYDIPAIPDPYKK
jgi:hypothetical protein